MDKIDFADIEKQYSKLAIQEEYLRTLKELSEDGKDTAPKETDEDAEQNPVETFKEPEPVAEEEKNPEGLIYSIGELNEKISFFSSLKDLSGELAKYWDILSEAIQSEDYRKANLIITSIAGNGKSALGRMIGEAVVTAKRNSVRDSLLMTTAEEFNGKDISELYKKQVNGCLIIENADKLSAESILTMKTLINIGDRHPLVILETDSDKRALLGNMTSSVAEYFANEIEIPVLNNNELADFAVYYADSIEFDIDKMAVLSVHHLIENRQSYTHHVSLAEIVGFVDAAVDRSGKNLFKKLIFSRTKHELERPVLTERDFERM